MFASIPVSRVEAEDYKFKPFYTGLAHDGGIVSIGGRSTSCDLRDKVSKYSLCVCVCAQRCIWMIHALDLRRIVFFSVGCDLSK